MELAPIALFVYNRPLHTRQTVETLLNNKRAGESDLFVFSDGPRTEADIDKVSNVRDYIRTIKGFKRIIVKEQKENRGLANSIISGVTETVARYGKIIVLEDDLTLSPGFLTFMNDALDIYKNNEKVMHVSGYMFPVKGTLPETFFYRATSCWGWATWKRAWKKFEPDVHKLLLNFSDKKKIREFDIEDSTHYYKMLRNQSTGKVDSWAIRWYASVFLNAGLCLHPGKSLVNNIGLDGTGIHCDSTSIYNVHLSNEKITDFTRNIEENENAVKLMAGFYRAAKKPLPLRVMNRLRRLLK